MTTHRKSHNVQCSITARLRLHFEAKNPTMQQSSLYTHSVTQMSTWKKYQIITSETIATTILLITKYPSSIPTS